MINKERLIKTFLELVKIDSPSGEEGNMAKEVAKRLKALGGKVEFDSFGNLVAKFQGVGEPFMINSHLDTVEPGRGIKPKISGHIIKTDGSTILGADNKAGVALILEALTVAKEQKAELKNLEVAMTLGEEAGLQGALNLDYSLVSAKEGVTFDGHGAVSNVTTAAPGYNRVDVTITGIAAHAGVEPEKGLSAIRIASEVISSLQIGRIDEETTANIGLIEGGSARNAVPERAHFKGEIRSRNIEKLERHSAHFHSVLAEAARNSPDAKLEVEIKREFDPYFFEEDHPIIQQILAVFAKMGIKPNLEPSGGGSDVNIFNSHGINIVDVGTGVHDMHTKKETLDIKEFVEAAEVCYALIKL